MSRLVFAGAFMIGWAALVMQLEFKIHLLECAAHLPSFTPLGLSWACP